jgi:predicted small lipoprotein YifL
MKTNSTTTSRTRALAVAALVTILGGCGQSGPLVLPDRSPSNAEPPQAGTDVADEDEAERER